MLTGAENEAPGRVHGDPSAAPACPAGAALEQAAAVQPRPITVVPYAGLRWGDAAGPTQANVDLARSRMTVRATAVKVQGAATFGQEPKTARSKRVAPVARPIIRRIEVHLPAHLVRERMHSCSRRLRVAAIPGNVPAWRVASCGGKGGVRGRNLPCFPPLLRGHPGRLRSVPHCFTPAVLRLVTEQLILVSPTGFEPALPP